MESLCNVAPVIERRYCLGRNLQSGTDFLEEVVGENTVMTMMNFSQAYILVYYSSLISSEIDPETGDVVEVRDDRFFRMNFNGNILNTLENDR